MPMLRYTVKKMYFQNSNFWRKQKVETFYWWRQVRTIVVLFKEWWPIVNMIILAWSWSSKTVIWRYLNPILQKESSCIIGRIIIENLMYINKLLWESCAMRRRKVFMKNLWLLLRMSLGGSIVSGPWSWWSSGVMLKINSSMIMRNEATSVQNSLLKPTKQWAWWINKKRVLDTGRLILLRGVAWPC